MVEQEDLCSDEESEIQREEDDEKENEEVPMTEEEIAQEVSDIDITYLSLNHPPVEIENATRR